MLSWFRGPASLLTCVVMREGAKWDVSWASDGKTPPLFSAASLKTAIEEATTKTAALYAGKRQAAKAELQFAIYPWEGSPGEVIFDITQDGTELVATDIQGSGITFRANSVDELVDSGARYVPDPSKAMFRLTRRVSELSGM